MTRSHIPTSLIASTKTSNLLLTIKTITSIHHSIMNSTETHLLLNKTNKQKIIISSKTKCSSKKMEKIRLHRPKAMQGSKLIINVRSWSLLLLLQPIYIKILSKNQTSQHLAQTLIKVNPLTKKNQTSIDQLSSSREVSHQKQRHRKRSI